MIHLTATPTHLTVTLDGQEVACSHVVLEASLGQSPQVTIVPLTGAETAVDGVVRVVSPPTPEQVDAAAREALSRVDKQDFETRCITKLRQGGRDPYQVALEVLREIIDG